MPPYNRLLFGGFLVTIKSSLACTAYRGPACVLRMGGRGPQPCSSGLLTTPAEKLFQASLSGTDQNPLE